MSEEHLDELEGLNDELLDLLRGDDSEPPESLADETIQRVRASITTRDMIDLTTLVFLLKFCAPLIDMIGAIIGSGLQGPPDRSDNDV